MRRLFFQVHRWLGLIAAAALVFQAASGSFLVFRHRIARLLQPESLSAEIGPAAPFSEVVASVRSSFPRHRIDRAVFPRGAGDVYLFRLHPPDGGLLDIATVDPHTARVLDSGELLAFPSEAALFLHGELLSGERGRRIVGTFGVSALLLGLTGVYLWWPGKRRLGRALHIHPKGPPGRLLYDLHKVPGALAFPTLALLTASGTLVAFRAELRPWIARLMEVEESTVLALPQAVRTGAELPLDALLTRARERFPGQKVRDVRFQGERLLGVLFYDTGNPQPRAVNQVWLDAYTGAAVRIAAASSAPRGDRFLDWMLPIHCGEALGLPGRLGVLATGLTLLVLAVTGPWLWLVRYRARRKAAVRAARAFGSA